MKKRRAGGEYWGAVDPALRSTLHALSAQPYKTKLAASLNSPEDFLQQQRPLV